MNQAKEVIELPVFLVVFNEWLPIGFGPLIIYSLWVCFSGSGFLTSAVLPLVPSNIKLYKKKPAKTKCMCDKTH